jgi:hypothetical protein
VLAPNPKPGCVDETKGIAQWAPPKGAVWDAKLGWMFNGHQLLPGEGDVLRLPDGRVRLFVADMLYMESGAASPEEATASAKLGVKPIFGEIEMPPGPKTMFPIHPGANSLGWATANG